MSSSPVSAATCHVCGPAAGNRPEGGRRHGRASAAHGGGTPLETGEHKIAATISVGVAQSGPDAGDIEALMKAADAALLEAKRLGRNRVAHRPPQECPV